MKQKITRSLKWTEFSSTCELSDFLQSAKVSGPFVGDDFLLSEYQSFESCGTKSLDEANDLLKFGDEKSYQALEKAWEIPATRGTREEFTLDVVGFAPCVPAYLMNLPVQMYATNKVNTPVRVVNVCYNCAVSYSIKKNEMIARANKLFNIIEYLEDNGMHVNLSVCCLSESGPEIAGFMVRVKNSNERISLYNSAYCMINPSILRRHFLRYVETIGVKNTSFTHGYGHPVTKSKMNEITGVNCLDYYDIRDNTPEQIINMIVK